MSIRTVNLTELNELPTLRGLVLLVGPPGSGKSTFAKKMIIQQNMGEESYISNDMIAKELFNVTVERRDKDGEIFAEQDRRIAIQLAANEVAVVMRQTLSRKLGNGFLLLHGNMTHRQLLFVSDEMQQLYYDKIRDVKLKCQKQWYWSMQILCNKLRQQNCIPKGLN